MKKYIFIDDSGSPQFYAKGRQPLWIRPDFVLVMSLVDYMMWALQRYIIKEEKRYFAALTRHYTSILDVYENEGTGKLYQEGDLFELKKASSFSLK